VGTVADEVIPLFPLGHVLMPGAALPLRIFEPRYRQLLADVTGSAGDRRFGVVVLVAGLEVETELADEAPRLADVGTMAEIIDVEPDDDGTSAVLTVGSSRFHIEELLSDSGTPYLQARVRVLDEPLGELPEGLVETARSRSLEYQRLIGTLTGVVPDLTPYPNDAVALSYRIANDAPLPAGDRQALLTAESAAHRLRSVSAVLRRETVLLRETRSIPVEPGVLTGRVLRSGTGRN
jgi:Lon protease-like protein